MGISGIDIVLMQVWVINQHMHTSEQVILHMLCLFYMVLFK